MKLTQREQGLLFVLALVTLGVGGIYFGVMPMLEKYEQAKVILEENIQKQMEAQILLDKAVGIDQKIEQAKQEAQVASRSFLKPLKPEAIDDWIHELAQNAGVHIIKNTMSEPFVKEPEFYRPEETLLNYPIKQYFEKAYDLEMQVEQKAKTQVTKESRVSQVSIQLGVKGTDHQIIGFIDALTQSGFHVRVEQFGLGQEQSQIHITLYMIEQEEGQE
ncbi:MAG: hypothetical protein ACRCTE_04385 [Cellulosilyticaceae bacterium]